jgi:hypothetical protein
VTVRTLPCIAGASESRATTSSLGASVMTMRSYSPVTRYSPENWHQLEADLRSQHLSRDVTLEDQTRYGQKYSIRATLVGPSGSSADVVGVWVVRTGEELPRFVTAYPEVGG